MSKVEKRIEDMEKSGIVVGLVIRKVLFVLYKFLDVVLKIGFKGGFGFIIGTLVGIFGGKKEVN